MQYDEEITDKNPDIIAKYLIECVDNKIEDDPAIIVQIIHDAVAIASTLQHIESNDIIATILKDVHTENMDKIADAIINMYKNPYKQKVVEIIKRLDTKISEILYNIPNKVIVEEILSQLPNVSDIKRQISDLETLSDKSEFQMYRDGEPVHVELTYDTVKESVRIYPNMGINTRKLGRILNGMNIEELLQLLDLNMEFGFMYFFYKTLRWVDDEKIAKLLDSIPDSDNPNEIPELLQKFSYFFTFNSSRAKQVKKLMNNLKYANSEILNFDIDEHTIYLGGKKSKRRKKNSKRKTKNRKRRKSKY